MQKLIYGLIGVVAAAVGVFQFWGGMQSADIYNEYVAQITPLMEKQDQLYDELQKSTDEESSKKIDSWVKRSQEIEQQLKIVKIDEDWVKDLNKHVVARSKSFTFMLQSAQKFHKTGEDAVLAEMEKHAEAAGNHMDRFLSARDAYAKENDFEIEE